MIPTLATDRLTLRAPTEADFPPLCEFYASDHSKFVGGPLTPELTWRALACEIGHWALRGYGRWAVEVTDTAEFIGIIGLWMPNGWPEVELGWDLMPSATGKGYATEAAFAARAYAYDTLGWTTLTSFVSPANTKSAAVAKRMGAVYERDYVHERHGPLQIYRHPGPSQLKQGST